MSLAQLQEATAFLVRFPELGRGIDWQVFVGRYDLSEDEAAQLHYIAHNNQVAKFGKKLRRFRFVDVAEGVPTAENILGAELFETLWFEHFEPLAASIPTEDLSHDFLKFLCENDAAQEIIKSQAPVHAPDFLTFIYLEMSLGHKSDEWLARPLPAGSLLMHGAVCPLAIYYDVPKLIQKPSDDGYAKVRRAPKPFYYVLLLKDAQSDPSLFAIDKSVYEFMNAHLTNPEKSPERPAVFSDLVKAGVCREWLDS